MTAKFNQSSERDDRIRRLEVFEKWKPRIKFDFESIVSKDLWNKYWDQWKQVTDAIKAAQAWSIHIKGHIESHLINAGDGELRPSKLSLSEDEHECLSNCSDIADLIDEAILSGSNKYLLYLSREEWEKITFYGEKYLETKENIYAKEWRMVLRRINKILAIKDPLGLMDTSN